MYNDVDNTHDTQMTHNPTVKTQRAFMVMQVAAQSLAQHSEIKV